MNKESTAARARRGFAELAIIIVGVLIALAAESAWQDRKDRAREEELLVDLLEEFRENLAILEDDIAVNAAAKEAADEWSDTIKSGAVKEPQELASLVIRSLDTARFDPATGVLQGIISSGELSLIQNDVLRAELAGWVTRADEANLTGQTTMLLVSAVLDDVLAMDTQQPTSNKDLIMADLWLFIADFTLQLSELREQLLDIIEMLDAEIS